MSKQVLIPLSCVVLLVSMFCGVFWKAGQAQGALEAMAKADKEFKKVIVADMIEIKGDVKDIQIWMMGRDSKLFVPMAELKKRIEAIERVVFKGYTDGG